MQRRTQAMRRTLILILIVVAAFLLPWLWTLLTAN